MKNVEQELARKYAQAFLNCFADTMTAHDITRLKTVESFLQEHQTILFFLSLSHIKASIKKQFLRDLFTQCGAPDSCNDLARTLIESKRGQLLLRVLTQIVRRYKEQHGIKSFVVTTAQPLTTDQMAIVEQFLARMVGYDIMYHYTIDKTMIAGIRLQSDTLLWEYSIGKQLSAMSH